MNIWKAIFNRGEGKGSKSLFAMIWLFCIIGSFAAISYTKYLHLLPDTDSLSKLLLIVFVQSTLFYAVICALSYFFVRKTDLEPFKAHMPFKKIIYPGILSGILVGLTLFALDKLVFHSTFLSNLHPPFWAGALASIYGGINEEVILRLFLFTILYYLLTKLFKNKGKTHTYLLWTTNILTALAFGLGHLPAVFKIELPSSLEICRVIILNGVSGLVFGWLYFARGFWAAALAHFVSDLVLQVFLI